MSESDYFFSGFLAGVVVASIFLLLINSWSEGINVKINNEVCADKFGKEYMFDAYEQMDPRSDGLSFKLSCKLRPEYEQMNVIQEEIFVKGD
jgi:hypothetical protein